MVINRKSWHYRLQNSVFQYNKFPGKKPKGLCGYFWKTIGAMIEVSFVMFVLVASAVVWLIFILAKKTRRTETWQLVREYAAAVKNRVCPLVEYEKQSAYSAEEPTSGGFEA